MASIQLKIIRYGTKQENVNHNYKEIYKNYIWREIHTYISLYYVCMYMYVNIHKYISYIYTHRDKLLIIWETV